MINFKKFTNWFSKLTLGTKIYFSLTAILVPVFSLIILLQIRITQPLLEDEVRQIGLSACRSLGSDIIAQSLLSKPNLLETRIIEMTWQQPSLYRLSVFTKELVREKNDLGILQDLEKFKLIGSNVEDEKIPDSELFKDLDIPRTNIRTVDDNPYWEVLYPVRSKSGKNIVAYIYAEVSMKVVSRVTGIFFKITVIGALVAILLLIWSLSFYLKRLIENEKLLRIAEVEKVELTEQLQLTQQQLFLNEKLAIMGQLTASFAHEIGTPLHSLSGHLQLLSGELKNKKDLDRIEIINSQVSRIEGIVKNFLASTHSPTQKKEMVDVHLMLEKIINLVSPRLQNQKIEVQFSDRLNQKPVYIVPSDLEQVFINIINNSMDALSESKNTNKRMILTITEAFDKHNHPMMVIKIKDNAGGMNADALKNVFKPFFTTKKPGKGTGLGLNISQGLVKKYSGKLELDSELGKGTTVTVNIPYDSP